MGQAIEAAGARSCADVVRMLWVLSLLTSCGWGHDFERDKYQSNMLGRWNRSKNGTSNTISISKAEKL